MVYSQKYKRPFNEEKSLQTYNKSDEIDFLILVYVNTSSQELYYGNEMSLLP